jgi:hypothetical protein
MPMKRRVDKSRNGRITVEAVALFERGLRLRAQQNWSQEIADNAGALAIALAMQPWESDVFDCPNDEPPPWMADPDQTDSYYRTRRIRLELEAALRAKRRRKAPASDPPPAAA